MTTPEERAREALYDAVESYHWPHDTSAGDKGSEEAFARARHRANAIIDAYRDAVEARVRAAPSDGGRPEVTEAMVEACVQYELSTYSRPTFAPIILEQAREFYRGVLTAALRARSTGGDS